MLGSLFYHSLMRKYAIMFGNMFNDITVRRFDVTNNTVSSLLVPITYAPKRKWVAVLADGYEATERTLAIQLPRIGFFFPSIAPDFNRMMSALNKVTRVTSNKNELFSAYQPIPYKINAELSIFAKSHDDASQIVEQIIPYFTPDFTNSMNLIPDLKRPMDIVTRITSVNNQEVWDGSFQTRQAIVWTVDFEIDAWFYGPVQKQGVIKRVQVDFIPLPGADPITQEEMDTHGRMSRVIVKPGLTVDGKPTSNESESIIYLDIDKDDDYGYITSIEDFDDGKRFDPNTLTDVPIVNTND